MKLSRPLRSGRLLVKLVLVVVGLALQLGGAALAVQPDATIVVADVRGPLEQRALDFLTEAVRAPGAVVVVLQINNPGIASGDPTELYAAIEESPVPVAVWVGPSGAEAYGGVAELALRADYAGAAPASRVGFLRQPFAGGPIVDGLFDGVDERVIARSVEVAEPIPGLIDEVVPTVGQFIAALDGLRYERNGAMSVLTTVRSDTDASGNPITVAAHDVEFRKPGLFDRFLRLAVRPEATFFFLAAGISAAVFEFYAAGAGVAASVSVLSLFLAGFGLAVLPISWFAVGVVLLGMLLYTVDFQNTTVSWRGVIGTVFLLWGGLNIVAAGPQFAARWWAVVLAVIGVASFYMIALTTVTRSRFSTITIGREHLVGRTGIAETSFEPMGIVDVDGARWQARSHRAAGLRPGDRVRVLAVSGIMLEVGPVDEPADVAP